jgi:hypothetical protein
VLLQAQLSALVSKCKPGADDLEYFLLEAGQLVGLDVPPEQGAKVRSRAQSQAVKATRKGSNCVAAWSSAAAQWGDMHRQQLYGVMLAGQPKRSSGTSCGAH